jgi:hypothetical protein
VKGVLRQADPPAERSSQLAERVAPKSQFLRDPAAHQPGGETVSQPVLLTSRLLGSRAEAHFRNISSKFINICQIFRIFLQNSGSSSNFLEFPAIPAKFREICGEKSSIWRKFSKIQANFAKKKRFKNMKLLNPSIPKAQEREKFHRKYFAGQILTCCRNVCRS